MDAHSTAPGKRPRSAHGSEEEAEEAGEPRQGVAMAVSCSGSRVGVAWFDEGAVSD